MCLLVHVYLPLCLCNENIDVARTVMCIDDLCVQVCHIEIVSLLMSSLTSCKSLLMCEVQESAGVTLNG